MYQKTSDFLITKDTMTKTALFHWHFNYTCKVDCIRYRRTLGIYFVRTLTLIYCRYVEFHSFLKHSIWIYYLVAYEKWAPEYYIQYCIQWYVHKEGIKLFFSFLIWIERETERGANYIRVYMYVCTWTVIHNQLLTGIRKKCWNFLNGTLFFLSISRSYKCVFLGKSRAAYVIKHQI